MVLSSEEFILLVSLQTSTIWEPETNSEYRNLLLGSKYSHESL